MYKNNQRRTFSTRQAKWKLQWIAVLIENGIDREEAEQAFNVYYGNQEVDIFKDPIEEASTLCCANLQKID